MSLQLVHLLQESSLGLTVVAGADALSTRGPIRWIHGSELPDPTPWMEGGEVLLTTGLGVKDRPDLQRRFIQGLAARDCVAVGFGIGVVFDEVPQTLVDEANRAGLPLFTVPYEVPFIALTKLVSHHVLRDRYRALRAALDLHRQVVSVVTSDQGIQAVLDIAARQMPDFGFVVMDYYGRVLAEQDAHGRLGPLHRDCLWDAVADGTGQVEKCEVHGQGRVITGSLVRQGRDAEALFAMVGDRPLEEHEILLREQTAAGVTLSMSRQMSLREMQRLKVDQLLESAATGRASQQFLAEQAGRVGIDAAADYRVLCIPDEGPPGSGLCSIVEDAVEGARPVAGRWDGSVYLLLQPADSPSAEAVVDALGCRGWPARVGRSRAHCGMASLDSALREARIAVSAAGDAGASGVSDVDDLDVASLLVSLEDGGMAQPIVDRILGPVIAHDGKEGTAMVDSLAAYLRHGCRPGPAADDLCVHRHTLAYRLDRIRALTGRDPRDGRHMLEYTLALELYLRTKADLPMDARAG